jgi:hypothetical protein
MGQGESKILFVLAEVESVGSTRRGDVNNLGLADIFSKQLHKPSRLLSGMESKSLILGTFEVTHVKSFRRCESLGGDSTGQGPNREL